MRVDVSMLIDGESERGRGREREGEREEEEEEGICPQACTPYLVAATHTTHLVSVEPAPARVPALAAKELVEVRVARPHGVLRVVSVRECARV